MFFNPFPAIYTKRLFLRRIIPVDWERILFLRSDATVNQFIHRPESEKTKTKADALTFIQKIDDGLKKGKFISWGITLQGDPQIIGTICLWNFSEDRKTAEVGYDLHPEFQRKGIMSEALKQVVDFGLHTLNLQTIEAFTHIKNESSKRLLVKNGFVWMKDRVDEGNSHNVIFVCQ